MKKISPFFFALIGALLFPLIIFAPGLLDSHSVLLYRDLGRDFLIQKSLWADSVRAGEGIPYWNFLSLGGIPYYSMNVVGALNPLNLIFLFFSKENYTSALTIFLYAHYVLLFLGSFFFVRSFSYSLSSACILALPIAFSGYSLSAYCLPHILGSLIALPFFLGFLFRWQKQPRFFFFIGISVASAIPIYMGDPQFTLMFVSIFAIYLLYTLLKSPLKLSALLFLYFLSLLLFSAAQLLPTLELLLSSSRGIGEELYENASLWSLHPERYIELLIPHYWGEFYPRFHYFGEKLQSFPGNIPFILCLSLGAFYWCLAFLSYRKIKANFLGAMLLFFTITIPMGSFFWIDINAILYRIFPLWNFFRYPERLIIWLNFIFYVWVLKNSHSLWNGEAHLEKRKYLSCISILTVFFVILSFFSPIPLRNAISYLILAITISIFYIYNQSTMKGKRNLYVLKLILALLCCIDIFSTALPIIWWQDKSITESKSYPLLQEIHHDLITRNNLIEQGAPFRFSNMKLPSLFALGKMENWQDAWPTQHILSSWEALEPNIPAYFNIASIHGFYTILPKEKNYFINFLGKNNPQLLWNLMGVYYLPQRGSSNKPSLFINKDAYPYLAFVESRIVYTKNIQEAIATIMAGNFSIEDPNKNIIASAKADQSPFTSSLEFKIIKRTSRELNIGVITKSLPNSGYILWNESYDSHWKAYWNGTLVNTFRANGWSTAVEVSKNQLHTQNELHFVYENSLILYGQWITIIWSLLVFGILLCGKVFYKNNGPKNGMIFSILPFSHL